MDKKPFLSAPVSSYGTIHPGPYVPPVSGTPGMVTPQAPNFEGAVAPPAMFDSVPGYEGTGIGSGGKFLPPPNPGPINPGTEPPPSQKEWNIPSISEETARSAFVSYASSKCCYSSTPAKQAVFSSLEAHNTYRYRLETFTESRSTEWAHEPYHGQPVDAYTQPAPGPWDIPVQAPALFTDSSYQVKVPYTSSVKGCHACIEMGRVPCKQCAGAGNKQCWVCHGSGCRLGGNMCSQCNGRGYEDCTFCGGQGTEPCNICSGSRQLLVYIKLTVKWTNNTSVHIGVQQSGFPADSFSKVSGNVIFVDSQYMVYPVTGFPDPSICQASQSLVREHQTQYSTSSRVLQQRQTIDLIPVTKVNYTWDGKAYSYFVYGVENKVKTDDYPAKCCCTVM
ncbi:protein SSUH2 homolog isoform X1 [Lepisosteus oculatus]